MERHRVIFGTTANYFYNNVQGAVQACHRMRFPQTIAAAFAAFEVGGSPGRRLPWDPGCFSKRSSGVKTAAINGNLVVNITDYLHPKVAGPV